MRRHAWKVHGALWLVQVAFASQAVEGKLAMASGPEGGAIHPVALAMVRMMGASLFFLVYTTARRRRAPTSSRDKLALAGLSILGIVLNQTLFLVGLHHTSSTAAALLSVTIPVFTAAMAVAMRVERASVPLVSGLALAVVGVVWLTGVRGIDRGAVIVTVNSLCYSSYLVLSRPLIRKLGPLTVVTWIFWFGTLLFIPIGMRVLVSTAGSWTWRSVEFAGYIVVVPTIVAYLANAWALGRSTPSLVTIYVSSQPVLAAILAWVQLDQPLTRRLVVAAAFILSGVALVVTRPISAAARET